METYATIKGQVVIPARLRKKFNIKAGTKIHVIEGEDEIILKPITRTFYDKLRGSLKGKGVLKALAEDRARERER
jgi:AbrB family looped-hinge helix DNA binding protein